MKRPAGIVLAAGEGSRFGGAKQLVRLHGRPMLEHVLRTMSAACDPLVVVLGAHSKAVLAEVDPHGARPVVCATWRDGIFASLRCGMCALRDVDAAVVVALGDQPTLARDRIDAVLATDGRIVRALDRGRPSHPVVIRDRDGLSLRTLRNAPGVELGPLPDVDTELQLDEVSHTLRNEPR